ncbi:hypothetical protein BOTBODRAFT_99689 [Botryobasidium botryosum FD-172 SS1]|uniref:Ribonuclease H2 subunit B wHTH domain-containing protein n=1 Tax=Botryobasidium botryosum (strain FD-172 SS1) TaxID=930990 RepID=A0A067N1J2_BOTB1|nr:hypothetical protein BOTBODRAFT_99689 [Botryobasidium botryosum FD-172 SS1]
MLPTGIPCLFLPCENDATPDGTLHASILEVQAVSPDASRSWFLEEDRLLIHPADGKLLAMTPIDPVFLLIPILLALESADGESGARFRPIDDLFEDAVTKMVSIEGAEDGNARTGPLNADDIMRLGRLKCTPAALQRLCDCKEAAVELIVYRFSRSKLLDVLRRKTSRLAAAATFDSLPSLKRGLAKDGLGVGTDADENLRQDGRTKTACDVISQYLPAELKAMLLASYDFDALNTHLARLHREDRLAAVTPASIPKPGIADDGEGTGNRNGKKRKAAAQASRGVEKLKKASTTGMPKLSNFFKKSAK